MFTEQELPPEPTLIDALRDFLPIAIKHLKLDHIPKIRLVKEIADSNQPTFGRYVNKEKIIYIVVDNRNPVDVLRTLAHELVHYQQGEEHRLDQDSGNTGSPIEDEANAEGGVIMRLFNQAHPVYMTSDPIEVAESKRRLDAKCWKGYKKQGTKMKGDTRVNNCVPNESVELVEEFNLIESIIDNLADRHQVDAEVIWEDLESLSDDELYVFAVTQETVNEDWQKVNKRDKTDGMSKKAVSAYRREHPGSKLKTAVTTKPSKLKRGSKASKRRKSYCSRSKGQMNMHNISCAKTPDKAICKARRRWNC